MDASTERQTIDWLCASDIEMTKISFVIPASSACRAPYVLRTSVIPDSSPGVV
jgi:hypothetical protein